MDAERTEDPAATPAGAWLQHYKAASRRRRAGGKHRRTRTALKRQRLRDNLKALAATLGVFLLAGVFYLLLTR
jgi:hypothetical protein